MEYLPSNQEIENNEPLSISPETIAIIAFGLLAIGLLIFILWPKGSVASASVGGSATSTGMSVVEMAELLR
jgi:hypothetical protein